MVRRFLLAFAALALLALVGCSLIASPDRKELGPEPQICAPGACSSCPCTDGQMGQQLCNAQSTYDPCVCPSNPACPMAGGAAGSGS
jgi:hypothetical protein